MESIKDIIDNKRNNVINGNKYTNDNNVNKDIYSLNKANFIPNTEESLLAERIASELNDLKNFAYYFSVVKKIGTIVAERLLRSTLSDIKEKSETRYPVRNKGKYFAFKLKRGLY